MESPSPPTRLSAVQQVLASNGADDPAHLYKFRAAHTPKLLERLEETIVGSRLYFASPRDFNDPFDCRVHLNFAATFERRRRAYEGALKRHAPGIPRRERRARAKAAARDVLRPSGSRTLIGRFQADVDQVGILSLAVEPDNPLLWSHYSYGHTGVCLKFGHGRSEPFFGRALPLNYSTDFPVANPFLDDPGRIVEAVLLTKSSRWSYEREWRAFELDGGPGTYEYPAALLKGVILGVRASPELRSAVAGWLATRNPPAALYEAKIASGSYELTVAPVE